jgi:MFS family permease
MLELFQAAAYLLGPVIAILALEKFGARNMPFHIALMAYAPSAVMFFILNAVYKRRAAHEIEMPKHQRSISNEFKVLRILGKKIWPIFIFTATIQTVDAAFWSIGVLLSEQFRQASTEGGLFMVLYGVAGVLVGAVAGKVFKPTGKKHMAFLMGTAAGISAILIGMTNNIYLVLVEVALIAVFYNVAVILISAVFEDYVARLGTFSNDMVGISLITNNVAYLSGPIILGAIAQGAGLQRTFIYLGIYVIAVSVMALVIVPKKVRLPQKELATEFS